MPAEPILTLGEVTPERPLVAVNTRTPAGPWERFKARYLLRWFPNLVIRTTVVRELFPMRMPSEFGLEQVARIQAHQRAIAEMQLAPEAPGTVALTSRLLREVSGVILDAPADVLDALSDTQHIQLLLAFPAAVTAQTPTRKRTENPSTSAASSPASAVSTAPMTG